MDVQITQPINLTIVNYGYGVDLDTPKNSVLES